MTTTPISTTPLTIAVLGPGGVGGLLAGLLARAGHRVICLAGEDTAAVLNRDGLHVRSGQFGEFTARVEAATELREPVDAVFVTVKETALADALDRLPPQVLGAAVVVPLLNGLDHVAALRERYPTGQVAAGTIRVEATRTAPGRIEHTSPFVVLELAGPVADLADRLRRTGLTVELREDETAMLWSKLSFLAPFALLTTRYRSEIGVVRTAHRPELLTVLDEIATVSGAAGAPADAPALLTVFDRLPGSMKSSMQRDVEAGRPTELDAIGGAVLRAAAAHGIDTPALARLVRELSEPAKQ
ncbi:2-dehydropantoate 2-reductase [Kitasatospora sp. MAA19]|uniref:ketopantoate reductase family protein n=1 Tax=Kitasatospora sp. MAA19 TaxID=3035090 RepID=UPI002473A440|nr:2-dehydropantoate 2-reductase [Kitasatospora sp. MAA19]MDH6706542.1 2-dehydropantoate 2-reductase [Kitasatospora sp. MAA19]